jgi:hypothetical protein
LHRGTFASAFCRSTSGLDAVSPHCIRESTDRDQPATYGARRSAGPARWRCAVVTEPYAIVAHGRAKEAVHHQKAGGLVELVSDGLDADLALDDDIIWRRTGPNPNGVRPRDRLRGAATAAPADQHRRCHRARISRGLSSALDLPDLPA